MKCDKCGGKTTQLFNSWICENPGCEMYKPPSGQKQEVKCVKGKVGDCAGFPGPTYNKNPMMVGPDHESCLGCNKSVKINQHADTFCQGCGFPIINKDIIFLTVARIKTLNHQDVDGPRAVFVNESSLPTFHRFKGVVSQGGDFITGYDGSGGGPKVNIHVDQWFRDYCAESSVNMTVGDHVVLLRQHGCAVWAQLPPHGLKEHVLFLFSASYGGNGMRIKVLLDDQALKIFG